LQLTIKPKTPKIKPWNATNNCKWDQ